MQSELHRNVVHHGVELLLLVSMPFLLAIPNPFKFKGILALVCTVFPYPKDYGYIRLIPALTNSLSLK